MKTLTYTNIIAFLGIAAFFVAGAAFVVGSDSYAQNEESLLVEENPSVSNSEGVEILALLNEMQKITLSTDIFKDPLFLNLKDFTVVLPEEQRYRPNPFAPIGKDAIINIDTGTTTKTAPFITPSRPSR
jgi:hypothetical protein